MSIRRFGILYNHTNELILVVKNINFNKIKLDKEIANDRTYRNFE